MAPVSRSSLRFSPFSWPILALMLALSSPHQIGAAAIERFLTPEDLAGHMVLDQNGQQIHVVTADHRSRFLPDGSSPAYLMIPLHGGEHIPASVPSFTIDAQSGAATLGPVSLDTQARDELDALLASSRLVVLNSPGQSDLVELLPGRTDRNLHGAASSVGSAVTSFTSLLSAGTKAWGNLTARGMSELEKLLKMDNSSRYNTVTKGPSLNIEAQEILPPLPAPIPEPSAWIVFACLAISLAVRHRPR